MNITHANYQGRLYPGDKWLPENVIEIEQKEFLFITEKISNECRYPLLALRVLMHIVCGLDTDNQIDMSARQLAKRLLANYCTVTKCLKYLREIGAVSIQS